MESMIILIQLKTSKEVNWTWILSKDENANLKAKIKRQPKVLNTMKDELELQKIKFITVMQHWIFINRVLLYLKNWLPFLLIIYVFEVY